MPFFLFLFHRKDLKYLNPPFQVLISEASKGPSVAKQSKDEKKSSSSLKENKPKSLSESHIGMDSRLLSALLTVGINCFLSTTLDI